jgi:hypothetical protein
VATTFLTASTVAADDLPIIRVEEDWRVEVGSPAPEDHAPQIVGEVRAIPVFSSVSDPGNNATYIIERFVGVRIMDVRLTGNPNNRRVVIQPAPFSDPTVIRGNTEIRSDSIFTTPVLIR